MENIREETRKILNLLMKDSWPKARFENSSFASDLDKFLLSETEDNRITLLLHRGEDLPVNYEHDSKIIWMDISQLDSSSEHIFDTVILYDILDHVDEPLNILRQIKKFCHEESLVKVRCHSMMSRHGSHQSVDKAYVHLFLDDEDAKAIGIDWKIKQKYLYPLKTQREWFRKTEYEIISEKIQTAKVEDFFRENETLSSILSQKFNGEFPEFQMSQEYTDYTLRPIFAHDTYQATLGQLKFLLDTNFWPDAVHPMLICDPNSEDDKKNRGHGIVELMVEEDIENLKFLDFGCGEGYSTKASEELGTSLSVGFDITPSAKWNEFTSNKCVFTTSFADVIQKAPYDVVLAFDVFDHVDDIEMRLKELMSVCNKQTRVYVRLHPFISRHGSHLYHQKNKAFLHCYFTDQEIKSFGLDYDSPKFKVLYPLRTYRKMINDVGFEILTKRDITESLEDFFKKRFMVKRLENITGSKDLLEFPMTIQFVDYLLRMK